MEPRALGLLAWLTALAVMLGASFARADDGAGSDLGGISLAAYPAYTVPMRPIGRVISPGHAGGGPKGGVFVGVDTGVAVALAAGFDPVERGWTFGARTGYEFSNGLTLQLRYDHLGVTPHFTDPPSHPPELATAGVRYSIPFLAPMPFFEAMWGPAVTGDSVSVAGGLGIGASVPIGRHFRLDLSVRDWLVPIDAYLHQILTFELGAMVTFASPSH